MPRFIIQYFVIIQIYKSELWQNTFTRPLRISRPKQQSIYSSDIFLTGLQDFKSLFSSVDRLPGPHVSGHKTSAWRQTTWAYPAVLRRRHSSGCSLPTTAVPEQSLRCYYMLFAICRNDNYKSDYCCLSHFPAFIASETCHCWDKQLEKESDQAPHNHVIFQVIQWPATV